MLRYTAPKVTSAVRQSQRQLAIRAESGKAMLIGNASNPILTVPLGPSQCLYARKGSLIGVKGVSIKLQLELLFFWNNPMHGLFTFGLPFAYSKLLNSGSEHVSALVVPLSGHQGLYILRLDGTKDFIISQRNALLSWSSEEDMLSFRPRLNKGQGLSNYCSTVVTGRGEVCLSGFGDINELKLEEGEEELLRSKHVVAYSVPQTSPVKVRLDDVPQSSRRASFRHWLLQWEFFRVMMKTETVKWVSQVWNRVHDILEKLIWGDKHFTRFVGPITLLVQSRSSRPRSYTDSSNVTTFTNSTPASVTADKHFAQENIPIEPNVFDAREEKVQTQSRAGLWDASTLKVATVSRGKVQISDTKQNDLYSR